MSLPAIVESNARNGRPTLIARFESGRSIYLHSAYDPPAEAQKWLQAVEFKSNDTFVLFGLGLGYQLEALLQAAGSESLVFVVEPSAEVVALASHGPAGEMLKHSRVHLCSGWEDFLAQYRARGSRWRNVRFLKIPSYAEAFAAEYGEFTTKLHRELTSLLVDRVTTLRSAWLWQVNLIKNLRYINDCGCVASVIDQFPALPVVVVSAGPSLRKNLHLLHRIRGKALIVAVGTVAPLLEKEGLTPDILISFDGGIYNFKHHFESLRMSEPLLLFDPSVHYQVVESYAGPKAMMLSHPGNGWLERRIDRSIGAIRMGPSVANTAFDFALAIGGDPVIFVGQDLAFTDNLTHAPGTHVDGLDGLDLRVPVGWGEGKPVKAAPDGMPEAVVRQWCTKQRILVEGIAGGKVATDQKMLTFLGWFEDRIRELPEGRTVINATEGGAAIPGTRAMALQAVCDSLLVRDQSTRIADLVERMSRPLDFDRTDFEAYLKQVERTCKRLARSCEKGLKLSRKLRSGIEHGGRVDLAGINAQLSRIDRQLTEAKEHYQPLHYLVHTITGTLASVSDEDSADSRDVARLSEVFYEEMGRVFRWGGPEISRLYSVTSPSTPKGKRRKSRLSKKVPRSNQLDQGKQR